MQTMHVNECISSIRSGNSNTLFYVAGKETFDKKEEKGDQGASRSAKVIHLCRKNYKSFGNVAVSLWCFLFLLNEN